MKKARSVLLLKGTIEEEEGARETVKERGGGGGGDQEEEEEDYVKELQVQVQGLFLVKVLPLLAVSFSDPLILQNKLLNESCNIDAIILTSPRASAHLTAVLEGLYEDAETQPFVSSLLASKLMFVVGEATLRSLRPIGDLRLTFAHSLGQDQGNAENLAQELVRSHRDLRFLFLTGDKRREVLPNTLRENRVSFTELRVYETVVRKDLEARLTEVMEQLPEPRWVIFFSPSTVGPTVNILRRRRRRGNGGGEQPGDDIFSREGNGIRLGSIGETTKRALEALGCPVLSVARQPNPASLACAVKDFEGQCVEF